MQLTIVLPDHIGRRVRRLPDPDRFITELVEHALTENAEAEPAAGSTSRWAEIAQRIEKDPVHLEGYADQLKRDTTEFREGFELKHDR